MSRPLLGQTALEKAKEIIISAKTIEQLRQAQAVVFPLEHGLSLEQTARAIGHSKRWTSTLRNRFIRGLLVGCQGKSVRGGRRKACFTPEREAAVLKPLLNSAAQGGVLIVRQIKPILEKALGRPMALSSVYALLHRQGWRKIAPDKRHPKSDPVAQEGWKKNSPKRSRKSKKIG
jgi:transposase